MWKSDYFFSFWRTVFFLPQFPQGQSTFNFETISTGTSHSVIPKLRRNQKVQLVLNFFQVATLLLSELRAQFLHIGLIRSAVVVQKYFIGKNANVLPCVTVLMSELSEKCYQYCRISTFKLFFPATRGLISSIRALT